DMFAALATLAAVLQLAAAIGWDQSAAVVGQLRCHGEPAAGVLVKLYDDDFGPDLDDLMAEGHTDSEGRFTLSGTTDEVSTIDPKLNIYHDCDETFTPCQRRITIEIPKSYVTNGKIPTKTFDFGAMELAGKFAGETRDCFHKRR
ncbi:hypothetical protein PFISCL1PPCAC_9267, partial [Pristionchus fissidentatus]